MDSEPRNDAQEPERTSLPQNGSEKPQAWELIDVARTARAAFAAAAWAGSLDERLSCRPVRAR